MKASADEMVSHQNRDSWASNHVMILFGTNINPGLVCGYLFSPVEHHDIAVKIMLIYRRIF